MEGKILAKSFTFYGKNKTNLFQGEINEEASIKCTKRSIQS